jgi:hypothetical protein
VLENSTGVNEKTFIRILDDYFLEQINKFPTRGNNILDLVISSIPSKISISEILKPSDSEILTDHSAIIFELTTACNPLPRVKRSVFDYRRADFDRLRAHLQTLNLEALITDNGGINQDLSDWKNAFLVAVKQFVPVKNLKARKFLPWMNNTILHLIKMKISLRMKIIRSSSPSEYQIINLKASALQLKRCCVTAALNT